LGGANQVCEREKIEVERILNRQEKIILKIGEICYFGLRIILKEFNEIKNARVSSVEFV